MTDDELFEMHEARAALWASMVGRRPLGALSPAERAEANWRSFEYRRLGVEIVDALKARSGPAVARDGRALWLTADRLAYAEVLPRAKGGILGGHRRFLSPYPSLSARATAPAKGPRGPRRDRA